MAIIRSPPSSSDDLSLKSEQPPCRDAILAPSASCACRHTNSGGVYPALPSCFCGPFGPWCSQGRPRISLAWVRVLKKVLSRLASLELHGHATVRFKRKAPPRLQ
ncbi:Hypothetical predicted protein, partial [Pelobates cultripes]